MSVSKSHPKTRGPHGFSLVELLVAIVFLSVLMGGMFKVFASSLSSFMASSETLGVQRNARWGLNLLQDEVLEAGFLFPIRPAPGGLMAGAGFQPPMLMQATTYTPPGATVPVDELQMVMDLPLNIQGTATAPITVGASSFTANIPTGAGSILAGDLLFIEDAGAEFPTISAAPGNSSSVTIQVLATEAAGIDPNTGAPLNPLSPTGGFKNQHNAGMPFTVIRPAQVVRYTVVPRALDPALAATDPLNLVPCLVRQTKLLVPGAIWDGTSPTSEMILLENVTGFAVDWSIDGGKTWLRASGAGNSWANISAYLNPLLTGNVSPFIQQSGGVYNPSLPMWTIFTPLLIRIDLTARSVMQRTEFNTAYNASNPQVAYRTRRETIMLSPRNCGIGLN